MTDREAIRQASILVTVLLTDEIITKKEAEILRQALQQPAQEPVAWISEDGILSRSKKFFDNNKIKYSPLYTAPPKREWVGLTDEEEIELDQKYGDDFNAYIDARDAKLKEKNI